MNLVVMKFGGTSVADAERIHLAARRAIKAKQNGSNVVMVVSAMGKSTDKLIDLAKEICPDPPRRELDMLMTTGEQVSMSLMAMAIHAGGHEAISLTGGQIGLITDSVHTKARIQKNRGRPYPSGASTQSHCDCGRLSGYRRGRRDFYARPRCVGHNSGGVGGGTWSRLL